MQNDNEYSEASEPAGIRLTFVCFNTENTGSNAVTLQPTQYDLDIFIRASCECLKKW